MDVSATDHVSHRLEQFEYFTQISELLKIANDDRILARIKGDISIHAFNENELIRNRVMRVLFVPDLWMNLFSLGGKSQVSVKHEW